MSILIQDARVNGSRTNVSITDNRIDNCQADPGKTNHEHVLHADGNWLIPGLMNGHTHAGMSLLRGYGEDLPLDEWLQEKIWPAEENLSEEDVYWGTRLACLEMIQSGTTFFNDMYWQFDGTYEAVIDSGIRAMISSVFIDQFDPELAETQQEATRQLYDRFQTDDYRSDRIQFALGPHSIYTVSRESLEWIASFADNHNLPVHIHLSETKQEVEDCREQHDCTPVQYLDDIGLLDQDLIAAHCVWLSDQDIELLADHNVSVVYNPISNHKLTAGADFRHDDLRSAEVPVCFGTDGPASNNNLNLFEEIKFGSLLQKNRQESATVMPAREAFGMATASPASIFNLNTGTIEQGALADLVLLDSDHVSLSPGLDTDSHLAYAISPEVVDTVICNGSIIMQGGQIEGEDQVVNEVRARAEQLRR